MYWLRLLLLAGALGVLLLTGRAGGPSLRVQVYEVELVPQPAFVPVDPVTDPAELVEALDALVYLNREAAAQVAQIGLLADPAQRTRVARAAAVWMTRAAGDLPQAGQYRARQQAVLDEWKQALEGYAAGRPGSLGRVRAASHSNAVLYADMLWQRAKAQETD